MNSSGLKGIALEFPLDSSGMRYFTLEPIGIKWKVHWNSSGISTGKGNSIGIFLLDSSGMHYLTLESSGKFHSILVEFLLDSSGMHYFPLESIEIPLESSGNSTGITPVGKVLFNPLEFHSFFQ